MHSPTMFTYKYMMRCHGVCACVHKFEGGRRAKVKKILSYDTLHNDDNIRLVTF